jgi:DNA-binding transcriptional LysR family regulator
VPKSTIKDYEEKGLLKSFPIPEKYNTTRTFFIRRKDSLMTNSLSKFIEMIELNTSYKRI